MRVAFISGHIDLTEDEFNRYYKDRIDRALDEGHSFVVGDAKGADTMSQEYIYKNDSTADVTVYHMFKSPLNNAGFKTIGEFSSHNKKDTAMTLNSDYDIAYVRPPDVIGKMLEMRGIKYNPKRKSGTQRNLDRRIKLGVKRDVCL